MAGNKHTDLLKLVLAVVVIVLVLKYLSDNWDSFSSISEKFSPLDQSSAKVDSSTASPSPSIGVAADLLPQPQQSDEDFSTYAPQALQGQNFLSPQALVGVDTIGSSMKSASYDIRNTIPIPKKTVGPWQNSTIDPDLLKRPLNG